MAGAAVCWVCVCVVCLCVWWARCITTYTKALIFAGILMSLYAFRMSYPTTDPMPRDSRDAVRVMTFNMRYGPSAERESAIQTILHRHRPHVVGVQEGERDTLARMAAAEGYAVYHSRDNYQTAILWDKEKVSALEMGSFTLSMTKGASFERVVHWVLLQHVGRDTPPVLCLNTHFDPYSETARVTQSVSLSSEAEHLIRSRNVSAIVTADFNTLRYGAVYSQFVRPTPSGGTYWRDAFLTALSTHDDAVTTFHGFSGLRLSSLSLHIPLSLLSSLLSLLPIASPFRWRPSDFHIDWLLYSDHYAASHVLTPRHCEVLTSDVSGVYPSDHYPVMCDFVMEERGKGKRQNGEGEMTCGVK
jgi:endonuclease/exonuclease/phosphatase family metal-dependent hydrolase